MAYITLHRHSVTCEYYRIFAFFEKTFVAGEGLTVSVDSQWQYRQKGAGSVFHARNVIGRGDTPLAVRVGWVRENYHVCSERCGSSIVLVDWRGFLDVECGLKPTREPLQIVCYTWSWYNCRRGSVQNWCCITVLKVSTCWSFCIHSDATVDVSTNETQLLGDLETSCWQRYSGHLPTRTRLTGTQTVADAWLRTIHTYLQHRRGVTATFLLDPSIGNFRSMDPAYGWRNWRDLDYCKPLMQFFVSVLWLNYTVLLRLSHSGLIEKLQ